MRFAGDALTGGYVDSAGDGGAGIHKSLSKKAPDYGKLGTTSMAEQAKEKMTAFASEGQVASAGLSTMGKLTEAQNNAKAGVAAAESKASATKFGAMMGMAGTLGGAAIGQFGSGPKWSDASDIGFEGNQVDKNGRLRY